MRASATRLRASLQGLSGDSIAILVAVGLVLGTFPVYGCPTLLCLLAAVALRINAPALQLVNQLASPLQLALLFPFARLGERILGLRILVPTGAAAPNLMSRFGDFTVRSIAGWLCLSLPLGLLLYVALSFALRHHCPARFEECENLA